MGCYGILLEMQESSLNSIQAAILRRLFQQEYMRFSELNTDNVPSDQFPYHLRQLVKQNVINKTDDGRYCLSNQGKGRAIMLSTRRDSFIAQAFVAVRVVLKKEVQGKDTFYSKSVSSCRIKEPTVHREIRFCSEKMLVRLPFVQCTHKLDTACMVEFKGIRHIKDVFKGEIMQDKFFFVFAATNPRGDMLPAGPTGRNVWLTLDELKNTRHSIQGGLDIISLSQSEQLSFKENTYDVSSY
jgi:hypothetical protein